MSSSEVIGRPSLHHEATNASHSSVCDISLVNVVTQAKLDADGCLVTTLRLSSATLPTDNRTVSSGGSRFRLQIRDRRSTLENRNKIE